MPTTLDLLLQQIGIIDKNSIIFQLDFYCATTPISDADKAIVMSKLGIADYDIDTIIRNILSTFDTNMVLSEVFVKDMLKFYKKKSKITQEQFDSYMLLLV